MNENVNHIQLCEQKKMNPKLIVNSLNLQNRFALLRHGGKNDTVASISKFCIIQ